MEVFSWPARRSTNEPAIRSICKFGGDLRGPTPHAGAVDELLGVLLHHLGPAQHRPLLGQHDQSRAARGGFTREPVGGREVAVDVLGRVELNGGCA